MYIIWFSNLTLSHYQYFITKLIECNKTNHVSSILLFIPPQPPSEPHFYLGPATDLHPSMLQIVSDRLADHPVKIP